MADVTDLEAERKKRKRKKKTEAETNFPFDIVMAMNADLGMPHDWPPFPRKFHRCVDDAGRPTLLEETEPGVVTYRDEVAITDAILQYCYGELGRFKEAAISHKQGVAIRNLWFSLTPPLAERPAALAEKSTQGLAFRRLAFDAAAEWPEEPPPRWAEFLSRCSQPQALCAFVGSLFYPDADRQQYLYLYGEGQDGKGSVMRMLFHLLGTAAQSLQPKGKDDRFWNMKVFGKRLVMFPDCDDFRFFASPEFKSLTGNDPIYFEEKGRMGFSAIPTCKLLAASNHRPNITSQKSDLRRLIYVEIKPVSEGELVPNYERILLDEAEAIVRLCKATYEHVCPSHGPIPVELATEVGMEGDSDMVDIFLKHFVPDENAALDGVLVCDVLSRENIRSGPAIRRAKEVWERVFGVKAKHTVHGNKYSGMRLKTQIEKTKTVDDARGWE